MKRLFVEYIFPFIDDLKLFENHGMWLGPELGRLVNCSKTHYIFNTVVRVYIYTIETTFLFRF